MKIEEIKLKAGLLPNLSDQDLENELLALRNNGVSFLGCVAFVQSNLQMDLTSARRKVLDLRVFSPAEKTQIEDMYQMMLVELNNAE